MANCIDGAFMDIVSNCTTQPSSGLEIKGWIGNLKDASFTYDINNHSKVVNINLPVTSVLYTIKGVKRLLNSGSSRLVRDNRADRFIQKINFEGFEFSVEASENLDKLSNVFIILVLRNKNISGNGVIRGYGLKYGISIDSDNWDANNNLSARAISLKSDDTSPEPHSVYSILKNDSYLETIAMLEALEVVRDRTYIYNRGRNTGFDQFVKVRDDFGTITFTQGSEYLELSGTGSEYGGIRTINQAGSIPEILGKKMYVVMSVVVASATIYELKFQPCNANLTGGSVGGSITLNFFSLMPETLFISPQTYTDPYEYIGAIFNSATNFFYTVRIHEIYFK